MPQDDFEERVAARRLYQREQQRQREREADRWFYAMMVVWGAFILALLYLPNFVQR